MKLGISISAALALTAFAGPSVAEQTSQYFVIKVTDRMYPPQGPLLPPYRLVHRGPYPVACDAVIFPRSLLCAGRPASFGPYAPYPWGSRVYY
jgi:hypothetical protein